MGFWAIAAPMLAGAASSALSAATTRKGTPGSAGYDYIVPKSVGEQSPTGKYAADYYQKAMEGFATGDPWRGYGDIEQLMKRKLQRGQTEAFYGTPGNRYGAYSTGMETGALAGLGGGRTQANLRPLQNQWLTGSQAIDEFLAGQRAQAMQQREGTMLQTGLALSQPYHGQVVPYMNPGTAPTPSPWASIAGGALAGMDFGSMFGGGGGGGQNFAQFRASTPPPGQTDLYRPGVSQASRGGPGYSPVNMSQYQYR